MVKHNPKFNARSRLTVDPGGVSPLISCLMVSRGDVFPAQLAIECYRRQTYQNRELVIVCAKKDSAVSTLVAILNDPTIRYIECSPRSLGDLRNLSVKEARGSLLCTWDDDDLHHPRRLELQALDLSREPSAVFLSRLIIWWPERKLIGVTRQRPWENSMLARREAIPKYPSLQIGEDSHLCSMIERRHQTVLSEHAELYCYVVHANNTCSVAHFESLFESAEWVYPDYESKLADLSANFPLKWYSDELRAQAAGGDGTSRDDDGVSRSLYSRRKFGSEEVTIDGRHFRDCVFDGTVLAYQGGSLPLFEDCNLGTATVKFTGSASNTLTFIRLLRTSGFMEVT